MQAAKLHVFLQVKLFASPDRTIRFRLSGAPDAWDILTWHDKTWNLDDTVSIPKVRLGVTTQETQVFSCNGQNWAACKHCSRICPFHSILLYTFCICLPLYLRLTSLGDMIEFLAVISILSWTHWPKTDTYRIWSMDHGPSNLRMMPWLTTRSSQNASLIPREWLGMWWDSWMTRQSWGQWLHRLECANPWGR